MVDERDFQVLREKRERLGVSALASDKHRSGRPKTKQKRDCVSDNEEVAVGGLTTTHLRVGFILSFQARRSSAFGSSLRIARSAVGAVNMDLIPYSLIRRQYALASGVPTGLPAYSTDYNNTSRVNIAANSSSLVAQFDGSTYRAAVHQRSVDDERVADGPAHVGRGKERVVRRDVEHVLQGPLERHSMPAVVAHDALGLHRIRCQTLITRSRSVGGIGDQRNDAPCRWCRTCTECTADRWRARAPRRPESRWP